jgi:multiple sugar transport system substrate-binding protein
VVGPSGLFYRKELFDQAGLKAPETWDDVQQAAQKLTKAPSMYGIGIGVSGPSGRSDYWWYSWIGAIGADNNLSRWGDDKKSLVANDHGIQAVQFLVDLNQKLKVTQPTPVNAGRDEDLQPLFISGKLAMLETGSWFPTIIQHDAPNLAFDVVPLPVAKAGMKHPDAFWPDAVMMFTAAKQKDAASELLKFMFNKDNRLAFAKQRGVVPERTDVGEDPQYAQTKYDKFFFDQLQSAYNVFQTPWPVSGTADDVTIMNGVAKAILGEKPVKDAMQEAAAAIDKSHGL